MAPRLPWRAVAIYEAALGIGSGAALGVQGEEWAAADPKAPGVLG